MMRGDLFLGLSIALVLAGGCGDDAGGEDAGPRPMDGGGTDAGPGEVTLPEAQLGNYEPAEPMGFDPTGPANYACHGSGVTPTPGDAVSFTLRIEDFQEGNPLEGVCLKFYADNDVPVSDSCDGDAVMSDEDGEVTVMGMEGGWYAYRVFPKEGPTAGLTVSGSVQFNEVTPGEGGSQAANAVSQATLDLIPTVLGFPRSPGTAIVAGAVRDCDDENVFGTQIRLYRADGSEILEGRMASDPHIRYFDGDDFPSAMQQWTNGDGLYASANIPVPSEGAGVLIEVWGRRSGDAEPVLLGCEEGRVYADTVTIVNVTPLRSDAPACPNLP